MKQLEGELIEEVGKIQWVEFGFGGYQGSMIGFTFKLGGKSGWGVHQFFACGWAEDPSESALWTKESRIKNSGEQLWKVVELLKKAKKDNLVQLIGTPIKAYFKRQGTSNLPGEIDHFEIFEEVL